VYLTYMSTEPQERAGLQAGMAEKTIVVLIVERDDDDAAGVDLYLRVVKARP